MSKIVDRKRHLNFKNKFDDITKKSKFIVVNEDIPKNKQKRFI